MKKVFILSLGMLLMISSCGTYEATGAFTGAQFGSIIGSAIGGISGGWRGHEVGKLIGLAGGATVGAAIGAAADRAANERMERRTEQRRQANAGINERRQVGYGDYDDSGFDPNGGGDDRILIDGLTAPTNAASPMLQISNARIADASHDGMLMRGESGHVVFEIHNPSDKPVYGIQPTVMEITGNKHIHISENILVECLQPKQTIRYTAQLKADSRLKNGEAVIRVTVMQRGREISAQPQEFRLITKKRL
jgi:hypothetical protein